MVRREWREKALTVGLFCAFVSAILAAAVARCDWVEVIVRMVSGGIGGGLLAWVVFALLTDLQRRAAQSRKVDVGANPLSSSVIEEVKKEAAETEIDPAKAAEAVSRMLR